MHTFLVVLLKFCSSSGKNWTHDPCKEGKCSYQLNYWDPPWCRAQHTSIQKRVKQLLYGVDISMTLCMLKRASTYKLQWPNEHTFHEPMEEPLRKKHFCKARIKTPTRVCWAGAFFQWASKIPASPGHKALHIFHCFV